MIKDKIIRIKIDGQDVVGEITRLEKYYIEVEILSPYINWKNSSVITGYGKKSPYNFLVRYNEVSERLLANSYKKLKMIDEQLDRIVNVYDSLNAELKAIGTIKNRNVREQIADKLKSWFFSDFIFTPSVTGLIASYNETDKIEEIIKVYKASKQKIYLNSTTKIGLPFEVLSGGVEKNKKRIANPRLPLKIKTRMLNQIPGMSQVTVKCKYTCTGVNRFIHLRKNTCLVAKETRQKSKLIYAENIPFYPDFKEVLKNETVEFLMVFDGLPKACRSFDFVESISRKNGLICRNIKRNTNDFYNINIDLQ